jgi:hypothetical protein
MSCGIHEVTLSCFVWPRVASACRGGFDKALHVRVSGGGGSKAQETEEKGQEQGQLWLGRCADETSVG